MPRYLLHTDVAGWYEVTPDEAVVISPYDLRIDKVSEALPLTLGRWRGEELGSDADIDKWYDQPDVVLRRLYRGGTEEFVWLTVIASRGPKSFHLFEHTPHSCHTSASWQTFLDDIVRVPIAEGKAFAVRRGAFARDEIQRVIYYWYQWDGPSRDPAKGVASWRLSTEVTGVDRHGLADAERRLIELARLLFGDTARWHRF
ncbi:MAG: exosortase-associated EpsI family protein [Chloroflexi bacterium]|nr:exosortase-associated EpsI family protein [Chloroflexota bacterium]